MSKQDELRIPDYLGHILEATNRIFDYLEDVSEITFLKDTFVQDAVLRNIEIIGEASRNLTRYHLAFTEANSEVPWEDMYWMRNRVSHGYFVVDLEIVWKVIEQDLPILHEQITTILKNMMQENDQ